MKNNLFEYVIPAVLVVLLISLVRPFGVGADHAMVMTKEGILLTGYFAFALWVWRERGSDEREELHQMMAGRAAYLAGSGVLMAGIVVQSLHGDVDRWLVYALIAMLCAKIVGSMWIRASR